LTKQFSEFNESITNSYNIFRIVSLGINVSYAPENLRVIIPVGGKAKRLLPLTAEVSKACIRLVNRPLIEISLLCLARQGVKNFIFGVKGYTNYRSLHDQFGSGVGFSARYAINSRIHIKYQPNIGDYGSADSARINMEYYGIVDPIFAVQGDNIFDVNLQELVKFHKEKEADMTIGLRQVKDTTGYGIAEINKDMRISKFVEKPIKQEAPSNLANTGLYLVTPKIRKIFKEKGVKEIIRNQKRLDFGYDLIPYLIRTGRKVYGYVLKGSWYDVGTPERYLEAMRDILYGKLKSLTDFGGRISEDATVWVQGESRESARRRENIIRKMKEGKIELEGAVLIGRHCQIEDGAEIHDSIIGRHVTVKSRLSEKTTIQDVSVVADDVTLEVGCELKATKVYPHRYVPKNEYVRTLLS